jgi:hypothetical protein
MIPRPGVQSSTFRFRAPPVEQLKVLEKEPPNRQREVKEKISSLLAPELRGWEEKCRQERERKEDNQLKKQQRQQAVQKRLILAGVAVVLLSLGVLAVWFLHDKGKGAGLTLVPERQPTIPEVALIPAGEFLMGSANDDKNAYSYE